MDKKRIWSIVKMFLKVGVTGLSLFLVFKKVDVKDLKSAFTNSNPLYLAGGLLFFTLSQLVSSSRLNTFFRGIGLKLSETLNFKIYLLGMFYNLFLPGGIGGDGYKIFLLRKKFVVKGRRLLLAIFFDRLSGLWALGIIICLLVIFIPYLHIPPWAPAVIIITGTVSYYAIARLYFPDFAVNFFSAHFKALAVQSLQVICVIILLYALNFNGKFSPYLLMFLVSSLVAIFPFTVGGLGARELVFVYGAQFFRLDTHLAVTVSLLFYCISAILSFTGIYFVFKPAALGENSSGVK